ncbi:GNAT family N-acetyltransferase [Lutimaribacter marinistellae]|uniref:GNAT family N-acetyltransferase n=1 Tax=Lutimaribacter marinistellae TaxID=1820329 RepID=A0ABV7TFR4_9RHOB
MTEAPIISTERLRLRPHVLSDMDAFREFFRSDRARYVDGPSDETHLWYGFASEVGSWSLCNWGGWAIETPDGALVGQVAITKPPHFAEVELGWILFDGFEGRGYAEEAARAALDWAFEVRGLPTLVSYIHRDNARSVALAKRLGAYHDAAASAHDPDDVVYRHPHPNEVQGGVEAYA